MLNNVFIVDDEDLILNMFKKAFEKAGYSVRRAMSAEEALAILAREKYQVMFFDLKLPGMNGVDLCRKIRKDNPMSVIIAVTGYGSQFEFSECRAAGFDDYFTKPVDIKTLIWVALDAFDRFDRWKEQCRTNSLI